MTIKERKLYKLDQAIISVEHALGELTDVRNQLLKERAAIEADEN